MYLDGRPQRFRTDTSQLINHCSPLQNWSLNAVCLISYYRWLYERFNILSAETSGLSSVLFPWILLYARGFIPFVLTCCLWVALLPLQQSPHFPWKKKVRLSLSLNQMHDRVKKRPSPFNRSWNSLLFESTFSSSIEPTTVQLSSIHKGSDGWPSRSPPCRTSFFSPIKSIVNMIWCVLRPSRSGQLFANCFLCFMGMVDI